MTNIRNHVDARHRDEDKSYVCEECNSEYKTLNSMRAHRSRVHGRKRKMEVRHSPHFAVFRDKSTLRFND